MNFPKVLLDVVNFCKPVLIKTLPIELLRSMKRKMIQRSLNNVLKASSDPFNRFAYLDGINLIGNVKAETGLGQSCRLVANELEHCCIPYSIYQYNQLGIMSNADKQFDNRIKKKLPYNINLIHINPHELGLAFLQLDKSVWNQRYNIGFWLWELEDFPNQWVPYFQRLDEIWTPSESISSCIRKKTDLPVVTIPYHVEAQLNEKYKRADFQLPEEKFLFLMMYDQSSVTERKNPKGVMKAYKRAFTDNESVGLVIKINNCSDLEIEDLKKEACDYRNVYFITRRLDRNQVNSLISCVDVVVSLHRAEGFGLVLAEAMLLGTPTIATNWSANTEFMTQETSCLVEYELIELKEDIGLFPKGNRWADPDINQAAMYMKKLYNDPIYYENIKHKAQQYIREKLSMNNVVEIINARVNEIYNN